MKLEELVGKMITGVKSKLTWNDKETEKLQLEFEGGLVLEVVALTHAGCSECDPDGDQLTYLSFDFQKPKSPPKRVVVVRKTLERLVTISETLHASKNGGNLHSAQLLKLAACDCGQCKKEKEVVK